MSALARAQAHDAVDIAADEVAGCADQGKQDMNIYTATIAGYRIALDSIRRNRAGDTTVWRVTYGADVRTSRTYAQAAQDLGAAIMHACALEERT